MQRPLFFFFSLTLMLGMVACSNEPTTDAPAASGPIEQTDPDLIGDTLIFFSCNDITQPDDASEHFEVFLNIATNKAKVGETESCDEIPKAEYSKYDIPAEAVTAIGDEEIILYVIRTSPGKVVVRQGAGDGEGGYAYRAMASFTTSELSSNPGMNQMQLVGAYAGQMEGSNMSYLLFVGASKKLLNAQLFRMEGPVPDPSNLMEAMKTAEPEYLRDFLVNMSDLTFNSSTGTGKFIPGENGTMQVQFDAILTPNKTPLVLDRMIMQQQ